MTEERRGHLFTQYDKMTRLPLLLLSIVFVIVLILPLIDAVPADMRYLFEPFIWFIWAIFGADLVIKLYLAPNRWQYLRSRWADVLTVAVPFLRALRLLAVIIALIRAWEEAEQALRQRTFSLLGIISLITIVVSAAIVYAIERHTNGPIQTYYDALWWAVTTITTVGYGDTYPVTPAGRSTAVLLMITGISLFGVLSARVAAFFVKEDQRVNEASRLDAIIERLDRLERRNANPEKGRTLAARHKPMLYRRRQTRKTNGVVTRELRTQAERRELARDKDGRRASWDAQ